MLVIGPSWIGDMTMSQSLYRAIKALQPGAKIDVMAPAWCRPLLDRMPEVSQALVMPLDQGAFQLNERRLIGIGLRNQGYQQAFVLPNSFKSALVPFFASVPKRTGWRGEMRYGLLNDIRRLHKEAFPLMVQRYTALAYEASQVKSASDLPQPIPWPQLVVNPTEIATVTKCFALATQRPMIGFCPGAEFGPAKRWPHYHYSALAAMLIEAGYEIVLFGSIKDHQAGETIRAALPSAVQPACINLAGKTSLDQAVVLIAACQAVVTNDSGLMHVAAALNKPLVALYGPSSPDFTPPLSQQARVIRLINGYNKIRKGDAAEGYHQSLIDIQPAQVWQELHQLLATN